MLERRGWRASPDGRPWPGDSSASARASLDETPAGRAPALKSFGLDALEQIRRGGGAGELDLPLPPVLTERRRQKPCGVHVIVGDDGELGAVRVDEGDLRPMSRDLGNRNQWASPGQVLDGAAQPLGDRVDGTPQRQVGLGSRVPARGLLQVPSVVGPADPPPERDPVLQESQFCRVEVRRGQVGLPGGMNIRDAIHPREVGKDHIGADRVLALHFLMPRLSHDPSSRSRPTTAAAVTDYPRTSSAAQPSPRGPGQGPSRWS